MYRYLTLFSVVALFTVAGCGEREPPVTKPKRGMETVAIEPQLSRTFAVKGKAGARRKVIVIGDGASYMGVYVYDKNGNCVAWDDDGVLSTRDDLAVEWLFRDDHTSYDVEVRNNGAVINECEIIVR